MEYLPQYDDIVQNFLKLEYDRFFINDAYKFTTRKTESHIDIKDYLINIARSFMQDNKKFKLFKQLYHEAITDNAHIINENELSQENFNDETLYKISIVLLGSLYDFDKNYMNGMDSTILCIKSKIIVPLRKIYSLIVFSIITDNTEQLDELKRNEYENMIRDFNSCYVDELGNLVEEGPNRISVYDYLKNVNNQQKQKLLDQMIVIIINEIDNC